MEVNDIDMAIVTEPYYVHGVTSIYNNFVILVAQHKAVVNPFLIRTKFTTVLHSVCACGVTSRHTSLFADSDSYVCKLQLLCMNPMVGGSSTSKVETFSV